MWIRSQNKPLVNANNVGMIHLITHDEETDIVAQTTNSDYFLGTYSTREKALKVLNALQDYTGSYYETMVCRDTQGFRIIPGLFTSMQYTRHTVFEMPRDEEVE